MKTLEEKKLLVKMARMLGQEVDPELLESIKREEYLNRKLLEKPIEISRPLPEVAPTAPIQEPAKTDIVPQKPDLVQQVTNMLRTDTPANPLIGKLRDKELDSIRKTIAEMMQKISTMSFGGGGTGVVRIHETDDFDKTSYGENRVMTWSDGMFRLAESDYSVATAATGEPMGHTDKSQSLISFDNASRTFSISPVNSSFEIWTKGIQRTITDTRTVTIPDTTGLYYIYFDTSGVLQYRTTFFDWPNDCITAYVYWNDDVKNAPFVGDERHGITLDWQTHEYLHRTRGAAIANGFNSGNYVILGDGSLDAHIQLDIASGTFFDEDLQVDIVATNTPVANTWEQDLIGPAQIPMFYLSGDAWVIDAPTDFPVKKGTARPQYNLDTAGVWTTTDIDNNKFGVTFILATNNINYPVIGIIGQSSHANQGDAEAVQFSDLTLTGFPVVEMRPLYKMVYDCKNSYSNFVKARLVSLWDLRSFQSIASIPATVSDHGMLTGLTDNDHPQYLLTADAGTGTYAANNSSNWSGSAPATLGAALDTLAARGTSTAVETIHSFMLMGA